MRLVILPLAESSKMITSRVIKDDYVRGHQGSLGHPYWMSVSAQAIHEGEIREARERNRYEGRMMVEGKMGWRV